MMEGKRSQQSEAVRGKKAFQYFGSVKSEFKKISWTSKEELQVYTKIVIAATFLFGMLVYFIDVFIQYGLSIVNTVLRFIAG